MHACRKDTNNKTRDALNLLEVKVPANLSKAHEVVANAQRQIIKWYPQFENLFRADAFNHFMIGTDEGKAAVKKLLPHTLTSNQGLSNFIQKLRAIHCPEERISYRKKQEDEARKILVQKPFSELTEEDWSVFFQIVNRDLWGGKELTTRFGLSLRGNNRAYMLKNVELLNNCAASLWQCDEKEIDQLLDKYWKEPIQGAGTGFQTLLLYLRTKGLFNIWLPMMAKGIDNFTGNKATMSRTAENYNAYNNRVNAFIKEHGLKPQETDIILCINIENEKPLKKSDVPLNLILYGPPGTGKTYTLRTEYFDYFTDKQQKKTKEKYAEELADKTAWWEIVTMALIEIKSAKVTDILLHPLVQAKIRVTNNKSPRAAVWAMLQIHTKTDCQNVQYTRRSEPLIFSKDKKSVWSIDLDLVKTDLAELSEKLRIYNNFTEEKTDEKLYIFTTFHQSYSYEEFVEGIKPVIKEEEEGDVDSGQVSYQIKPGIFKTMVDKARRDPGRSYAIFIDEISRGNVASIFGELITLIEEDKREGAENEIITQLPYSRENFVVPPNLHIIGTMNTADRSVVSLDNALRRRFSFKEIVPKPLLINQPDGFAVDLQKLLETINGRIEKLLDRDHVIGHSYFMEATATESNSSLHALQNVFANKILPLLQEYFYGDPAKIGMVLGEAFVKPSGNGIPFAQGSWDEDAFEERIVYNLVDPFTIDEAGFRSIYE